MKRSLFPVLGLLALSVTLVSSPGPARAAGATTLAPLVGASDWINGAVHPASLAGKVVLVDVFTFGCFNCKNVTPNLRALRKELPASDRKSVV